MSKYKKQVQEMLESHKDLFDEFQIIHDKYSREPDVYQQEFNEKGKAVQEIISKWEYNLCAKSNASQFSKFADNLSEKFRNEVRLIFSKIDFIGIT